MKNLCYCIFLLITLIHPSKIVTAYTPIKTEIKNKIGISGIGDHLGNDILVGIPKLIIAIAVNIPNIKDIR